MSFSGSLPGPRNDVILWTRGRECKDRLTKLFGVVFLPVRFLCALSGFVERSLGECLVGRHNNHPGRGRIVAREAIEMTKQVVGGCGKDVLFPGGGHII